MRRTRFIARQSASPSGLFGYLLGLVMSVETARDNEIALKLLDLVPTEHVLEVGFGHGHTIARAAEVVSAGFVAGVDTSASMVRMAAWRNRSFLLSGRVEMRQADAARLPYPDRRFDKVYTVHTIYFWPQPAQQLCEIRRVLKDGGRLVLGFRYDDEALKSFPAPVYTFYPKEAIRQLLAETGFERVRIEEQQAGTKRMHWAVADCTRPETETRCGTGKSARSD